MSLFLQYYQAEIQSGTLEENKAQTKLIESLNLLYSILEKRKNFFSRFCGKINLNHAKFDFAGFYIWGSVGIGKTRIMDLFYKSLTTKYKMRLHFHAFMQQIHQKLQQYQERPNPLDLIARFYSSQIQVLCFDEFFVQDIADAMILDQLLRAFFKYKIMIILTSNAPPEKLYENGLQRERFLPAIQRMAQKMFVYHLDIHKDYRQINSDSADIYFYPANPEKIKDLFRDYSNQSLPDQIHYNQSIKINNRLIQTCAYSNQVIWLDFRKICQVPRSQMDYLSIVKRWKIVILDNLDNLDTEQISIVRYFINLIDIFYDAGILLIINSAAAVSKLYIKGRFIQEFQRTHSRLMEMQSVSYMKQFRNKS